MMQIASHGFVARLLEIADEVKFHNIIKKTILQQRQYCSCEYEVFAIIVAKQKFTNFLLTIKW